MFKNKGEFLEKLMNPHIMDLDKFTVVGKAVSTDKTRYHINCARYFVEDNVIVATDGRRLVVLDCTKLCDSTIAQLPTIDCHVVVDKKQVLFYRLEALQAQFPNYKRVIPADEKLITNDFLYTITKPKKDTKGGNYGIPRMYADYGIYLDLSFILDLQNGDYKLYCYADKEYRYTNAVVLKNDDEALTIVIMPFQTGEDTSTRIDEI